MSDQNPTLTGRSYDEIDWDAVARRIRFLIDTNHLTVPDVAHDLGVQRTTLQEILDGQARPSEYLLVAAANYFGVNVDFLVSGKSTALRRKSSTRRSKAAGGSVPADPPGGGLRELAVRQQALAELLVSKGIISAEEYNAAVRDQDQRTA